MLFAATARRFAQDSCQFVLVARVAIETVTFTAICSCLPLAIAAGLVVGKQAGVFGAVWVADKLGISPRSGGMSWVQVWGIATLCGTALR